MASTVTDPIAAALASLITALSVSVSVKGRKYAPPGQDVDSLPAGVVYAPGVQRTAVDSAEDHLNQNDWQHFFSVYFYFDATDITFSQALAVEVTEAFIKAVDAAPTLSGTVQEAKVVRTEEPEIIEHNSRPALQVRTRVETLAFV